VSGGRSAVIDETIEWLLDSDARKHALPAMIQGLAERIDKAGIAVSVLSTSQQAYQPEVAVRNVRWTRETGVVVADYTYAVTTGPEYLNSPLKASRDTGTWLRVRLDGPVDDLPYPVCKELALAGNTDYFVKAMPRDVSTYISLATNKVGGFSEDDIAALLRLLPAILLRLELYCSNYALTSLLHLYLGGNAAERVIKGAFRLGSTEDIEAVVWMCDLRGFTSMTEKSSEVDVLSTLNQYFACVVTAVQSHGGEVLKFIGDAVLAIFPVGEDETGACHRAMAAAREAFHALDAANVVRQQAEQETIRFGLALHLGHVSYGNIGTRTRLDFTVIGPTVNEAARIEGLCSGLGRRLLVSESFAIAAKSAELESVGRHALKGVATDRELFTIPSLG